MDVLIIENKDKSDIKLLIELAKKLGSKVSTIDHDQFEETALYSLMEKVKTGKRVSRNTIMKKLKA